MATCTPRTANSSRNDDCGRGGRAVAPFALPGERLSLFLEQLLNGVQLGVMLFLLAAGLTLIFGIMNLINLAHGSLYMVGAFIAAKAGSMCLISEYWGK